jgi:hypothetical protein
MSRLRFAAVILPIILALAGCGSTGSGNGGGQAARRCEGGVVATADMPAPPDDSGATGGDQCTKDSTATAPDQDNQGDNYGPPGTANFSRCRVYLFASSSSQTYAGWIYASAPNTLTQYWVRVRNLNILGWVGMVTANNRTVSVGLWPYYSQWVSGPAMWSMNPRQRAYWSAVTISPTSDASSLSVEIWAPRCS